MKFNLRSRVLLTSHAYLKCDTVPGSTRGIIRYAIIYLLS